MATFKNLERVVCSKTFFGPNNLILRTTRIPRIDTSGDANINHIQALPKLLNHISYYNQYLADNQKGPFVTSVKKTLVYLKYELARNSTLSLYYLKSGGYLTPQAIADIYASFGFLAPDSRLIEQTVEPLIEKNLKNFSVKNLYYILSALKSKKSKIVGLLADELRSRNYQDSRFVKYDNYSSSSYLYSGADGQEITNPLIASIVLNKGSLFYNLRAFTSWLYDFIAISNTSSKYRLDVLQGVSEKNVDQLLSEVGGKH